MERFITRVTCLRKSLIWLVICLQFIVKSAKYNSICEQYKAKLWNLSVIFFYFKCCRMCEVISNYFLLFSVESLEFRLLCKIKTCSKGKQSLIRSFTDSEMFICDFVSVQLHILLLWIVFVCISFSTKLTNVCFFCQPSCWRYWCYLFSYRTVLLLIDWLFSSITCVSCNCCDVVLTAYL